MTADTTRMGQYAIVASNTAEQLPRTAGSTGGVIVKAKSTNAAALYMGYDATLTATSNSFELVAGEALNLEVLNLGRLWIYGTLGDRICWASVNA